MCLGGMALVCAAAPGSEPVFRVGQLHLDYFNPVGESWTRGVWDLKIALGVKGSLYTSPGAGDHDVSVSLRELARSDRPRDFTAGALLRINDAIRKYFERQGLMAVKVYIEPTEIRQIQGNNGASQLEDERSGDDTDLHIVVLAGRVAKVRTVASGYGVNDRNRINNRRYEQIRENSPVQAVAVASTQPSDLNLLKKNDVDDYVYRLNRQPGRRVDAVISAGDEPGTVNLDYLVQQNRPWSIYGQVSNTGTHQTKPLRERFGVLDTDLTGHDDVLSLDYVTADFSPASQALMGSYEIPILPESTLRARGYASYSSFVASDVGYGSEHFFGNETVGGAELIGNVYQYHQLFVDVFGGMRFESIASASQTTGIEGSADAGIPYVGARLQRATQKSSIFASATGEFGFTEADQSELDGLGRTDVDKRWGLLQADAEWSFFLEPVIWPSRYDEGNGGMLANEVAFSVRGQSALGNRLMPEEQQTVGGLYTVRGYPESLTAGDDMILGSAEYRFHVPRAFEPDTNPKPLHIFGSDQPFRWVPDRMGGAADWDLILKAFVDAAHVWQSDRTVGEEDAALISIGLGVEFQFQRYFNAQVYWGIPLENVGGPSIDETVKAGVGDSRLSFAVTLSY